MEANMAKEPPVKPMFVVNRDEDVEVKHKVKESTSKSLADYVEFLKESGSEAQEGEILDLLVPQALKKDKAFASWANNPDK